MTVQETILDAVSYIEDAIEQETDEQKLWKVIQEQLDRIKEAVNEANKG